MQPYVAVVFNSTGISFSLFKLLFFSSIMRTNSGVCQRRVWQLSTVESEARNSYALFERISGKGEMNSMVSINCPSIIDPINEKYSYSGVPVLVVKGILNKSRASNSHNYLIPINLSWWYLFSVRVRYS